MPHRPLALCTVLALLIGTGLYLRFAMQPEGTETVAATVSPAENRPDSPPIAAGQETVPAERAGTGFRGILNPDEASRAKKNRLSRGNLEIQVVESETNAPLPGASLSIFRGGETISIDEGRTDQNGRAFFGLMRGSYELFVDREGYALFHHGAIRVSNEKRIYVAGLVPGVAVSGQVRTPQGEPAVRAVLTLRGSTSQVWVVTDSGGLFRLRLSPGIYEVIQRRRYREPRTLEKIEVSCGHPLELDLVLNPSG